MLALLLLSFVSASGCHLRRMTETALLAHGSTSGAAAGTVRSPLRRPVIH